MNLATKAALYNALLFPGWGHIYLKKYKRGIIFILPILAGISSICWSIVQVAINILKAKPITKGTVDINTVFNLSVDSIDKIKQGVLPPEWVVATHCSILLVLLFMILLWILSIIDAYQLGKKQPLVPNSDSSSKDAE